MGTRAWRSRSIAPKSHFTFSSLSRLVNFQLHPLPFLRSPRSSTFCLYHTHSISATVTLHAFARVTKSQPPIVCSQALPLPIPLFLIFTMWALPPADGWHLDAFASFIVLVGEHRELEYRQSQHRWSSLFSFPAPVAGLQSYLHSNSKIIDRTGMEYISPYNSNKANLRNIRIEAIIHYYDLLRDRAYYRLVIQESDPQAKIRFPNSAWRDAKWPNFTLLDWCVWILFSWGVCGVFFWGMVHCPKTTWIGNSLCFSLGVWSLIIRLIDLCCIVPGRGGEISAADSKDATIFLGRRNSCVVLEGLRKDISSWTGRGLTEWDNQPIVLFLTWFRRLGTLAMLLFIFATIPNGTVADQVGFIIFNGIGQVNLLVCNHISLRRHKNSFRQADYSDAPTRTHVYGKLITYFRDKPTKPDWVEKVNLLPDTPVWKLWKERTLQGNATDAKDLYDDCRVILQNRARRDTEEKERQARRAEENARVIFEDARHEKEEATSALFTVSADANATHEAVRKAEMRLRGAEASFNLIEDAQNEKRNAKDALDTLSADGNAAHEAIRDAQNRLREAVEAINSLVERNQNQQPLQNQQNHQPQQLQQNPPP